MDLASIRKKIKKEEEKKKKKDKGPEKKQALDKQKPQKDEKQIRVLCFHLGKEIFALKMSDVQEIIRLYTITPIPRSPDYLLGVITFRGKILPVLDLKRKLNVPELNDADKTNSRHYKNKIIIGKGPKGSIGIFTERVIGVISIKEKELKRGPTHISEEQSRFIDSVAILDKRFITILNAREALSLEIENNRNGRKI